MSTSTVVSFSAQQLVLPHKLFTEAFTSNGCTAHHTALQCLQYGVLHNVEERSNAKALSHYNPCFL